MARAKCECFLQSFFESDHARPRHIAPGLNGGRIEILDPWAMKITTQKKTPTTLSIPYASGVHVDLECGSSSEGELGWLIPFYPPPFRREKGPTLSPWTEAWEPFYEIVKGIFPAPKGWSKPKAPEDAHRTKAGNGRGGRGRSRGTQRPPTARARSRALARSQGVGVGGAPCSRPAGVFL